MPELKSMESFLVCDGILSSTDELRVMLLDCHFTVETSRATTLIFLTLLLRMFRALELFERQEMIALYCESPDRHPVVRSEQTRALP